MPDSAPADGSIGPTSAIELRGVSKHYGIGKELSIVASVAGAHGGRLSARARPGGGLEVEVTLPAGAGPQARADGVAASVSARTA